MVLVSAENDAHGRAVIRAAPLVVVQADIHVDLADVLMGEFVRRQVEKDETLEQVVVEDEVDVEVLRLGADSLLAGDEREALAQFEEEGLQIVQQGVLQTRFQQFARAGQAEEFQQDRIADELAGCDREVRELLRRLVPDRLAVPTGEEAFVVEGADLAVEGAGASILVGGLVHVPRAGSLIVYAEQQAIVGPAQIWTQCV